jgi:NADH:ubiquinone oxidoreductase subunit 6 (subunit J)
MSPKTLIASILSGIVAVFIIVVGIIMLDSLKEETPEGSEARSSIQNIQDFFGVLVGVFSPDPLEVILWAVGILVAAVGGFFLGRHQDWW